MEQQILDLSKAFWEAMETADEQGMRKYADSKCMFTHIGVTCGLEKEIEFYVTKLFQPTKIEFHNKTVNFYGETAVVLTDCDYSLLLNGTETTHHFMVTEVYAKIEEGYKLAQFSFTALVY